MADKPMKTVRCRHCDHQWEVPAETTQLVCPKCGRKSLVGFTGLIKGKFL